MATPDDDLQQNSSPYRDGNSISTPEFSDRGINQRRAISTANQALSIARNLERSDEMRDLRRARIQSAYNGSAPYRQAELKSKGQEWRFNVSFRFLRGLVSRALAPYHDLGADESYLANILGQIPEMKLNIVREEFVSIVRDWGKWFKIYERITLDLALFGYDCAIFPSEDDPFPVVIPQAHCLVPEKSTNDVDELDVFCWKRFYKIHELFDFIKFPKEAKDAGWNLENTRAALENAMPSKRTYDTYSGGWLELQKSIREASLYWSYGTAATKEIKVFHVLVPEIYDDEVYVDQWIVLDTLSKRKSDVGGTELFYRKKMFKKLSDCLVYFYFEPGDSTWHGSMGVGWAGYNTHAAVDRLRCNMLDQAFMSSQIIGQAQNEISEEEQNMQVVGGMVIVPPSLSVLKERFPPTPQEIFTLDALLTSTVEQATGDMVPNENSSYRPGPKTATQSAIDAQRNQQMSRVDLRRFIDPFGKMISIMLRRLLKLGSPNPFAQEFQKNLMNRGLTPQDIAQMESYKCFGDVDEMLQINVQNSGQALATFRNDPDVQQRPLKKRYLAALISNKIADELMPDMLDPLDTLEQSREQMQENMAITSGTPMPVSPKDLHEAHAATAIADVAAKFRAGQMGQGNPISPQQLMAELQHAEQHVQYLLKDPAKKQIGQQLQQQINSEAQQIQAFIQQTTKALTMHQDMQRKALEAAQEAPGAPSAGGGGAPAPAAPITPATPSIASL